MTDRYMRFAQSTLGNKVCKLVGLPVPMTLKRANENPSDIVDNILIGRVDNTDETELVKLTSVISDANILYKASLNDRFDGIVFDARDIKKSEDFVHLFRFFNQHLKQIANCGKIVVIGIEPKTCTTSAYATAQRGLVGFIKALAKEVGRKGATVNIIFDNANIENKASLALASPLRYFLSYRSAYVNGQVISLHELMPSVELLANTWSKPLAGKVALVTGASRGIGAAIANTLTRDGATVIGLDIPQAEDELTKAMAAINGQALVANITEVNAPTLITERIKKLTGNVDIVVHNAGITRDKMLISMLESTWEQVIKVNLTSIERINDALLDNKLINKGGRIVCVSSISGIAGNIGQTNYAASKASIIGMIESLSPILAENEITINAVAPGFIETQMTASIPVLTRFAGRRVCALSQGGLPIDVAETISFLSAPQSQHITGNLVRVCGLNIMGA